MVLRDFDAETVRTRLGLSDDFSPWLEELASMGPLTSPVSLPAAQDMRDDMTRLGVLPDDAEEIIAAWPEPNQAPELWWLLQRCHQQLVRYMDKLSPSLYIWWQPLPDHLGTPGRLFYIYVYLSMLPVIRQWHQEHHIPDDISWKTLADLGEHIAITRRMSGYAGLDAPGWPTLHFRGLLYWTGRLQFGRWQFSPDWQEVDDTDSNALLGPKPEPGTLALDMHIPESGGSITPEACSASLEQAKTFFARYFPDETYRFARCSSWLLDPQLAEYLPATSNIVRFQRLFHLVPGSRDGDRAVLKFVFRRFSPDLDDLPQRTTLERAIVEHLRAGRHWQSREGWLVL